VIRIGLVGVGKIARDQHIPALAADARYQLVAAASRTKPDLGVLPVFQDIEEMLAQGPALDAVALCTPPQARRETALAALRAGKHVFLEKPPGASVGEVAELAAVARAQGVVLFTSWHSRFAAGVAPAKAWLSTRRVREVAIEWREDVRRWHPGQTWIWEAGGLGVFDPAINALSILTEILPTEAFVTGATLQVPENVQSPVAAHVDMTNLDGARITADLTRASLRDAKLRGANLGADMKNQSMGLMRGVLKSVKAQGADFEGANLTSADLEFADLAGAKFAGASLVNALCGGADFRGASVEHANFDGADLTSARIDAAKRDAFAGAKNLARALAE